jgi:DNA-binding NtrC family response regulator
VTHTQAARSLRVLVFSDDSETRAQVIGALGTRPSQDIPELSFIEVATAPMVFAQLDAGVVDAVIADGEASPAGGMGIAKQMKDELDPSPPVLVLLGRADDRWLAEWSRADAVATLPVDPIALAEAFVEMVEKRRTA